MPNGRVRATARDILPGRIFTIYSNRQKNTVEQVYNAIFNWDNIAEKADKRIYNK